MEVGPERAAFPCKGFVNKENTTARTAPYPHNALLRATSSCYFFVLLRSYLAAQSRDRLHDFGYADNLGTRAVDALDLGGHLCARDGILGDAATARRVELRTRN